MRRMKNISNVAVICYVCVCKLPEKEELSPVLYHLFILMTIKIAFLKGKGKVVEVAPICSLLFSLNEIS